VTPKTSAMTSPLATTGQLNNLLMLYKSTASQPPLALAWSVPRWTSQLTSMAILNEASRATAAVGLRSWPQAPPATAPHCFSIIPQLGLMTRCNLLASVFKALVVHPTGLARRLCLRSDVWLFLTKFRLTSACRVVETETLIYTAAMQH
jgi:hypothetical protein